jgi:type I restriction enzyme M protein
LAAANQALKQADFPDFNESSKLGDGKEKVERLTNLIAIFEDKALDFSKNRADGDDILGDAYEYLMRHFATESGKSKGQFYTPAEVSRIMAQIIGIKQAQTTKTTSVYDPTCGSGSLLLKVGDEAGHRGCGTSKSKSMSWRYLFRWERVATFCAVQRYASRVILGSLGR